MASEPELTAFSSDEEIEKALTQARATKLQIQRRVEAKKQRESATQRKHRTHLLVKIGAEFCKQNDYLSIEDLEYLVQLIDAGNVDFHLPDPDEDYYDSPIGY